MTPGSAIVLGAVAFMGFVLAANSIRGCILWMRACHRRGTGHCARCGYNLTGLTRPRCPECGTVFAPPAPSQASDHGPKQTTR